MFLPQWSGSKVMLAPLKTHDEQFRAILWLLVYSSSPQPRRDTAGFHVGTQLPPVIYLTGLKYRIFIRQAHSCYNNSDSLSAMLSGKWNPAPKSRVCLSYHFDHSECRKRVCGDTHIFPNLPTLPITACNVCDVEQETHFYLCPLEHLNWK